MDIKRVFVNVFVEDLARARAFYEEFLGFRPRFTSDWFLHLAAPESELLEVGLLPRDGTLVPESFRNAPTGVMISIVTSDVDAVYASATQRGIAVERPPTNQFYGQRSMLIRDPDGTLIDVSSECPPDPEWMSRIAAAPDGSHTETA